jgi:hypothetical protein
VREAGGGDGERAPSDGERRSGPHRRARIAALGRAAESALVVHQALQRQPIATSGALVEATGLTAATVNKALGHLATLAMVTELTNRQRGRVFSYHRYIENLTAELEP